MARFDVDYGLWPEHARPRRRWTSLKAVTAAFATGGVFTVVGLAVLSHMTISPAARAEAEAVRSAAERAQIQAADATRVVPLKLSPTPGVAAAPKAEKLAVFSEKPATDGRAPTQARVEPKAVEPKADVARAETVRSEPARIEAARPETRSDSKADRLAIMQPAPVMTPVQAAAPAQATTPAVADAGATEAKPKPVKKVAKKIDPLNPSVAGASATGTSAYADNRQMTASQRQDQMWRQMSEERRPTFFAPFGRF